MFYVYVLKLNNGQTYIGYTEDLKRRFIEHQTGQSKYTKTHRPLSLIYYEAYLSKKDAAKREKVLKQFKNSYTHLKKRILNCLEEN
ncbi:MAG: GIY-YIG nuclease family protein [Patescibacteria group bacterium]